MGLFQRDLKIVVSLLAGESINPIYSGKTKNGLHQHLLMKAKVHRGTAGQSQCNRSKRTARRMFHQRTNFFFLECTDRRHSGVIRSVMALVTEDLHNVSDDDRPFSRRII